MAKLLFLITSLLLAGHTLAQSNSTNETCPSAVRDVREGGFGSSFNSTGTISVQFDRQDEPWQISVSLTDMRAERLWYGDDRSMQQISLWLSVPESLVGTKKGNETNVCAYSMFGKNATATNATEPRDSCEGIISDECFDVYEAFDKPMESFRGGSCPSFRQGDHDCETPSTWTGRPTNFSSSTCALDGLQNVDLKDNYITFGSFPAGSHHSGDDEVDSFEAYDLKVRQPIPILFVVHYNGNVSAKMVCLAPNDLVGESRVPQSELPEPEDPNGAVAMRAGWTGVLVIGVALFASVP